MTFILNSEGISQSFDSQDKAIESLGKKYFKELKREVIKGAFYYGNSQEQIDNFKLSYLGIPMELENEC